MYKIEKAVPLPVATSLTGKIRATMTAMKTGESFFAPTTYPQDIQGRVHFLKQKEFFMSKFITRTVPGGVRVWRTS